MKGMLISSLLQVLVMVVTLNSFTAYLHCRPLLVALQLDW